MPPTNTLWDAGATTCEGQCTDTVWAKWDLWIDIRFFFARCQRILETDTRKDGPIWVNLKSGYLDRDIEFLLNVVGDRIMKLTSAFEDDQSSWSSDLQVDGLAAWRVGGVFSQLRQCFSNKTLRTYR